MESEPSTPKLRLSIQKRLPRNRLTGSGAKKDTAKPTDRDARTDAMLAVERVVWEAWRAHDAKKLADLTAQGYFIYQYFWHLLRNQGRCDEGLVRD